MEPNGGGGHDTVSVPSCLPVSIQISNCDHGSIPPTDLNQDRFADRGSFEWLQIVSTVPVLFRWTGSG